MERKKIPLIAHVIFRLDVGGLENGLVNIINRMPEDLYRHTIICLTDATDFRNRIKRKGVEIYSMNKSEGHNLMVFVRMYRLFRKLKPTLVHTRNLSTIECQVPAYLAGVPYRVHGEHGWNTFDPDGENRKYQWLRWLLNPFIHRFIALSQELEAYLRIKVGVSGEKITRICNGVDTKIFYPPVGFREDINNCPFKDKDHVLVGTVGRMHGVKDQVTLANAFFYLIEKWPEMRGRCRLLLVGEGPLRRAIQNMLTRSPGCERLVWLPGERNDIAEILRGLDVFVLPSQAEGISNTILEAMATGLPIIATGVGGNPDLVIDGESGILVPPQNPQAIAEAIKRYITNRDLARSHGQAGLKQIKENMELDSMTNQYVRMYAELTVGR